MRKKLQTLLDEIEEATGWRPTRCRREQCAHVCTYTPYVALHVLRGAPRFQTRHVVNGVLVCGPLRNRVRDIVYDLKQAIRESEQ